MDFSKPFGYVSIEKVLQFLEPNLRFQLSHQCQSIRSHEKTTPISIKSLSLDHDGIRVNATFCHLKKIKNAKRSKPGESAGGSAASQIQFSFGTHLERLVHRPELEAVEYMIEKLFGGRPSIKIQEFQLSDLTFMKITESLRIQTKAFELRIFLTTKLDDLKLPVDGPTIFTLSLIGCRPDTSHLNSQILKTADILNFEYARISDEIIPSLRHKKVKFLHVQQYTAILALFKHWLEHGREIGTHYSFQIIGYSQCEHVFQEIERHCVELKRAARYHVTVRMNDYSDIVVSCTAGKWILEMKVQRRTAAQLQ